MSIRCYPNKHLPGDWIVVVGEEYTATFSGLEAGQRAAEYADYLATFNGGAAGAPDSCTQEIVDADATQTTPA